MSSEPFERTILLAAPGCEPIVISVTITCDSSCSPEPYKAQLMANVTVGTKTVMAGTILGSGENEPRAMADLWATVLEELWEV